MIPTCSKCKFLTAEAVRCRPCAKIPIFHKNMLCSNEANMVKDNVTGTKYTPYCEEVNRHAECLEYIPVDLEKPTLIFDDDNLLTIKGSFPFVVTTDGAEPSVKQDKLGVYDVDQDCFIYEEYIDNSCVIKAACIEDDVLSEIESLKIEISDIPKIIFDKSTNTVTIKSYNKVYYTTDGSKVTEDSKVYDGPFVIDHNTTIKAKSYANEDFSIEVSQYCISIEPPVISFDPETNKVSIESDDEVLYSIDGSDIYDDSIIYEEPFEIDKNTVVKSACLVDGDLSEQVELECKVANPPVITYDESTHKVSIESENTIRYTIDGTEPKKSSPVYSGPFTIKESVTVKAVSETDILSAVSELECVFVTPPTISFDPESNTVSITGDNQILYSTDGSTIYDDSDEYTDPFTIEKNTVVKAACILNGILSEEVSLTCKVPSVPEISFNSSTKTVTIKGENTILYTTDGSDVKKKDTEYKSPFKVTQTTTVKAKSIVDGKMSEQAELTCTI